MPRPGKLLVSGLVESDVRHAVPTVVDVLGGSPGIAADFRSPFPDVSHSVLAKTVNNIARLFEQRLLHCFVWQHLFGALAGSGAADISRRGRIPTGVASIRF